MLSSGKIVSPPYRPGVGMMVINQENKVFLGQRLDSRNAWQMPQGGIDPEETTEAAMMRELYEEIGTNKVYIIASQGGYKYDLPLYLARRLWRGKYKGQQQVWFALRFMGTDEDINIHTAKPEFRAWRWAEKEEVIRLAYPFKRNLYKQVFRDLWPNVLFEAERIDK